MDFIMQYDKKTKSFDGDNILLSQGEAGGNKLKISKNFAIDSAMEVYIEFYLPKGIRAVSEKLKLIGEYYELVLPGAVTKSYGTASFQAIGYGNGVIVKSAMIYDKIEILQSVNAVKNVEPDEFSVIESLLTENSQQNEQILEQAINIGALNVKVTENTEAIAVVNEKLNGHDSAFASYDKALSNHSTVIAAQASAINECRKTTDSHGVAIATNSEAINNHKKLIDSQASVIAAHSSTIAQHSSTVAQHGSSITQHGNTITQHGNTIAQHTNSITTHNNDIAAQAASIRALQTSVGSKQNNRTLIYDRGSSDSDINWGYPNGIAKNIKVNKSLSAYKKLYCTVIFENHNNNTLVEIDLNTSYRNEFVGSNCGFYTASSSSMLLMGAIVKISSAKSQIEMTSSYAMFNQLNNTITNAGSPTAYIYRIEGETA